MWEEGELEECGQKAQASSYKTHSIGDIMHNTMTIVNTICMYDIKEHC